VLSGSPSTAWLATTVTVPTPTKRWQYLTLAGKRALDRAAFTGSQAQLQQGLEWVKTLLESAERFPRDLELASALVQVLTIMRGYSAPETVEAAEHASSLAEKSGNLAQLILQLSAIRAGATVSGDHPSATALADRMLDLAQREGSPTSLGLAHFAQLSATLTQHQLVRLWPAAV
jgi:hypothetical protein